MADIRMGYMGTCKIAGVHLFCTSLSISKKVEPLFFDHIYGLLDSGGGDGEVKGDGGSGGFDSRQKGIFRSSRTTASASASGPLVEGAFSALMDAAIRGTTTKADIGFYSGAGKSLKSAIITSLTIDVKAGEAASFSVELMGTDIEALSSSTSLAACKKIITWDQCNVTSGITGDIMSFSLSISNPAIPIHVTGDDETLGPKEIRIGMQEVRGSISSYKPNEWPGGDTDIITFKIKDDSYKLEAVFSGPTYSPSVGPFVCTIPFTGASDTAAWSQ